MRIRRATRILGALVLAGAYVLVPEAEASQWNKLTKLDINEAIRVPGAVLPPGHYVVRLADSPANRHIVRFLNEDQSKVIATVLAIPNRRMRPTGETQLSFYETPAGQPPALRAWFYPGDTFGQEFVYPKGEAQEIARSAKRNVPAMDDQAAASSRSQPATAESDPPVIYRGTRIYMWAPGDREVTTDAGAAENERMDRDPSWNALQKQQQRYGRFGSSPAGAGTPKPGQQGKSPR